MSIEDYIKIGNPTFEEIIKKAEKNMNLEKFEDIQYKVYEEKYQTSVINLITSIQQKEFNICISADDQPDLKDIPIYYQKAKGNFWIAINKNEVIGTIALIDIGNNEAALRKMFVHKDFRGSGVAKKLLEILLEWARKKQIKTIYLGTTLAFLAAHRFYEKNGFIEIKQEDLPKTFPVMQVDKKFYKHILYIIN